MRNTVLLLTVLLCWALARAIPYTSFYGDAVWSDLTGLSTSQQFRVGERNGAHDVHLVLKNEWYTTVGTDLPYLYTSRGVVLGAGYRYWLPGNFMFVGASTGYVLAGPHSGDIDNRVGAAGYYEWLHGKRVTNIYGELTWVDLAQDTFLNMRLRSGFILNQSHNNRLWDYAVLQTYASGNGANGTENRVEAGIGLGYLYQGHTTLNLELRKGYAFRGTINDKSYWNPMLILASSF